MSGGSTWARQEAEIDRLRAELAEYRSMNDAACARMNEAEAAIASVRELCTASDEAGNGGLRTWQITDALDGE